MSRSKPSEHEPSRSRVEAARLARLEGLRRVAMGAAHTLNNAFTTLVGEASFLREDRKADPVVSESCEVILAELDRCSRLTRALLARRHPPQQGGGEVDLVRLVRELADLLEETLGRQHRLELRTPDDVVPVPGAADALETLVLGLVHYAADGAGGPSSLRLGVEPAAGDGCARLSLEVQAATLPVGVEEVFLAPERAEDPLVGAVLDAIAVCVSSLGGARHAARTAPDTWTARLTLPVRT